MMVSVRWPRQDAVLNVAWFKRIVNIMNHEQVISNEVI